MGTVAPVTSATMPFFRDQTWISAVVLCPAARSASAADWMSAISAALGVPSGSKPEAGTMKVRPRSRRPPTIVPVSQSMRTPEPAAQPVEIDPATASGAVTGMDPSSTPVAVLRVSTSVSKLTVTSLGMALAHPAMKARTLSASAWAVVTDDACAWKTEYPRPPPGTFQIARYCWTISGLPVGSAGFVR